MSECVCELYTVKLMLIYYMYMYKYNTCILHVHCVLFGVGTLADDERQCCWLYNAHTCTAGENGQEEKRSNNQCLSKCAHGGTLSSDDRLFSHIGLCMCVYMYVCV